ncbi:hypothetical protein CEE37_12520 [candidate division LCP-89 bacterium B3_LCP]|uniref:L-2-amino-thiazoline-4-carboxylic acid hydrolase n=1 Tax=candidate division LCP-89 bacterium B3_LCP TaxID=2012998 RepID=A0A532UUI5_UNCL8|nr:MAG: hypothetical protein CEE37_12520 [candidate division LCP-89 bacterium B3_LCP]
MSPIPLETKFKVLCEITRAQHFAWRQSAAESCPDVDAEKVTYRMWEITGHETAKAYLKRLDPEQPLPLQIAKSMVWSSESMGESAVVEAGKDDSEAYVIHSDCPWFHWHKRLGLLKEDQPGCDLWFGTCIEDINKTLGTNVKIETLCSLPEGGDCCRRRIWVEK